MDQYLVYGNDYKTVREAVAKAVIEGKAQSINEAIEVFIFCLLFLSWYSDSDLIYCILYNLFIELYLYSKKKGLLYPSGPFPRSYQSISSIQPNSPSQTRGLRVFFLYNL